MKLDVAILDGYADRVKTKSIWFGTIWLEACDVGLLSLDLHVLVLFKCFAGTIFPLVLIQILDLLD